MSTTEPKTGVCPVKHISPIEIKPMGEWTALYDGLREEAAVVRSDFGPGFFVFTRHEDILAAYQDWETFSTEAVTVLDPNPSYLWIPHMLSGNEHLQWRRQLGPTFAPKTVDKLENKVRQRAIEIIDSFAERGSCDVIKDFSYRYPTTIFLELLGLPVEDLEKFMAWEADILHGAGNNPEEILRRRSAAMAEVIQYFENVIVERRGNPADDLISKALEYEFDGRPVTDEELKSYYYFMFQAGLDTVAAALGYAFYHLATHQDDRQRVVDDTAVIPSAIEEILRFYSFIIPSRKVTRDVEVAGCPIPAGSMVQLPLKASTRDEAAFEGAETFRIDRKPNNHLGFGAGPHRCLGSHLARFELRIALEEWHRRIPTYRLADDATITEFGRSSGPSAVPLVWDV
ncbi:cytochrome P450 [Rhodococcus sp. NPDC003318]|uniref:cytochrome P450 n=1 Tax=Rhodococcus sp. NPDC003318 TaxID=3364503 RepID=UPI0036A7279D